MALLSDRGMGVLYDSHCEGMVLCCCKRLAWIIGGVEGCIFDHLRFAGEVSEAAATGPLA